MTRTLPKQDQSETIEKNVLKRRDRYFRSHRDIADDRRGMIVEHLEELSS